MRVALAQLNPIVGDVAGNTRLVLEAIEQAVEERAQLLVTSELVVVGYPPRDLLLRNGVVEACGEAVERIAHAAGALDPELTVVVGAPHPDAHGLCPLRNSALVCRGGRVIARHDKKLLPGYDIFDEDRYFAPGNDVCTVDVAGRRVGVLICEDLWQANDVSAPRIYPVEPVHELVEAGCDVLVALNASPFVFGKVQRHVEQLRALAQRYRVPLLSVNQVGGQDDLIFDGRAVVMGPGGDLHTLLPGWQPVVRVVDLHQPVEAVPDPVDSMKEYFDALVLGVRDYVHKTGNDRALVGISGGIDSALTAAIAAVALGPQRVTGVFMPSRYSAEISREDAEALVENLGLVPAPQVSIENAHDAVQAALAPHLGDGMGGVTDENIQARIRGVFLMAFSNAGHGLVLATSNKSEMATGYSTLYGDMCGAVSVLGDLLKTQVYELSRWINANWQACGFPSPPIPERSITRPPTAELKFGQTDQDTLPPYEVLDDIVRRYIDGDQSVSSIIATTGLERGLVEQTARMIDLAQYKRDQASVVLKVSPRTFGRGRPMPIVMKQTRLPVERAAEAAAPPGRRTPAGAPIDPVDPETP
ncbi:MAG: NAD+ synthase [Planctomycetota bacterium]|jgi:NAD+ synthase (glutamine-hydrolysing)